MACRNSMLVDAGSACALLFPQSFILRQPSSRPRLGRQVGVSGYGGSEQGSAAFKVACEPVKELAKTSQPGSRPFSPPSETPSAGPRLDAAKTNVCKECRRRPLSVSKAERLADMSPYAHDSWMEDEGGGGRGREDWTAGRGSGSGSGDGEMRPGGQRRNPTSP